MKTLLDTSKIVLATAVLSIVVSGCEKRPADQTSGTAGTDSSTSSSTAPSTATTPGTDPAASTPPSSSMAPGGSTAGMPDTTMGAATTEAATSTGAAVASAANSVGTVVEDSVITAKLKTAILADTTLKDSNISVDTKNGTVALTGSVVNDAQKDHAAKIAQALEGVKSVDNKLAAAPK
ncbi:MAG: BON domain-containing protein [Pseudomonadota bacterium]